MSGRQDSTKEQGLSNTALGEIAEMHVRTLFLKAGFHVYPALVDDHGVDMVVMSPNHNAYFIQVKSLSAKTDYVYMKSTYFNNKIPNLYCVLVSMKQEVPETFLIPFAKWEENDQMFPHRASYTPPEYGINASKKNLSKLQDLAFDNMIDKLT